MEHRIYANLVILLVICVQVALVHVHIAMKDFIYLIMYVELIALLSTLQIMLQDLVYCVLLIVSIWK